MKKSIILLLCCISTISFLFAQTATNAVRIALKANQDTTLVGEQWCVKVVAFNFQNVDSLQIGLLYDPYYLQLDSLKQSNNGTALVKVANRPASITWKKASNTLISDSTALFEICFHATHSSGGGRFDGAYIGFVNNPLTVKALNNAGESLPLDYFLNDWNYRVRIFPKETIGLAITDTVTAPGKRVCLRVEVTNFEKLLLGMQFGVQWNPAFLQFDHINFGDIPNLQTSGPGTNFGFTDTLSGKLRFVWSDFTSLGIKLDRGDRFFEICFNALDTIGETVVAFSREVLAFEFFDVATNFYNLSADNGQVSINEEPQIWPGDTNRDGTVNQFDLLPIGLAYGNLGANRNDISTDWQPQPAADWTQTSPLSQINYKHFDTDGNGLIELLDAIAIDANWNLTTEEEFRSPISIQPRSQGAPLYVRTKPLQPSEQQNFNIILGEANQPAADVYGLAFSIAYDFEATDARIVASKVAASFTNSWLGTLGEDLLFIQRNNAAEKRIDIALVRTDGQNRSGYGAIGQLTVEALTVAVDSEFDSNLVVPFRIENVKVIDAQEIEQTVTPLETETVVILTTGINDPAVARKVRIFPNPTSDQLFIQTDGLTLRQIEIFNLQGQLLQRYNNVPHILTTALPTGMYTLRILTSEGVVVKSFVAQ